MIARRDTAFSRLPDSNFTQDEIDVQKQEAEKDLLEAVNACEISEKKASDDAHVIQEKLNNAPRAVLPATAKHQLNSSQSRSFPRSASGCPCGTGSLCTGPRGGRYCITSGGNKRYGGES